MPEGGRKRGGGAGKDQSAGISSNYFFLSLKVLSYSLLCAHSPHPIELQEGRSRIYTLTVENQVRDKGLYRF